MRTAGRWNRFAVVEVDQAPAHGIMRPLPFYDQDREGVVA
jgi:hypothetical protein